MASAPHAFATSMMRSPRRYDSAGRGPPMRYASSASSTCNACASIEEWTATVRTAMRRHVRITRQAISPRLAMRILENSSVRSRFHPCRVQRPELAVADVHGAPAEEDRARGRGGRIARKAGGRWSMRDEARELDQPGVRGGAALQLEAHEAALHPRVEVPGIRHGRSIGDPRGNRDRGARTRNREHAERMV